MTNFLNELGQPIGFPIDDFTIPPRPDFTLLQGNFVQVKPISVEHISDLYKAFSYDLEGKNWTYMPYGPFVSEIEFSDWVKTSCFNKDPKFFTIIGTKGVAGVASYLRIDPKIGTVEIGHIHLSPLLQRSREGTEALLLLIEWAFEAGYRRLEWKCDALNGPSRRAAQRLGFSFEGIFRQATIYKSRNRDTAWYAVIDKDWPKLKTAYHLWRVEKNFYPDGREIKKLSELTSGAIVNRG
jgi:RimJ/RimL family protein N-acetyltransferase